MGLEGVELVIAMEDAFGVSISDEEAENITTPEEAIILISNKVQTSEDDLCLNQRAFNYIRKILVDEFSVPRRNVVTESDLSKLVVMERQREFWDRTKEMSGAHKWPGLSRPAWIVYLVWAVFGVTATYAGIEYGAVPGCFIGLSIFLLGMFVTKPMKRLLPRYYSKMDALVRLVVSSNPNAFKRDESWSKSQIKQQVKAIVMEVLGTEEYDEKWKFVEDFGIG